MHNQGTRVPPLIEMAVSCVSFMDAIAPPVSVGLSALLGSGLAGLQSGKIAEALVLAVLEDGTARLQLPTMTVDVRASVPLVPGTTVPIAVRGGGAAAKLWVLSPSGAPTEAKLVTTATSEPRPSTPTLAEPATSETATAVSADDMPTRTLASVTVSIGSAEAPETITTAPETAPSTPVAPTTAPPVQLSQAVETAASRQGGLAPLLANLEQVTTDQSLPIPPPVRQAAGAVLSLRVPFDANLNADDVRQAVVRSGLFLEARLAASPDRPASTSPPLAGGQTPAPADLKGALLVLREAVRSWLGDAPAAAAAGSGPERPVTTASPTGPSDRMATPALRLPGSAAAPASTTQSVPLPTDPPADERVLPPAEAGPLQPADPSILQPAEENATTARSGPTVADVTVNSSDRAPPPPPPPPYRGGPTKAQGVAVRTIADTASPRDIAAQLLDQTEAALSRHVLLQAASLPDHGDNGQRSESQGPHWAFEIPLQTPQGTSIAQFEVARDGRAETPDQQTVWRARFSVNVEPMGPVHAQLALLGDRAAVTLWVERDASMARLRDSADVLAKALREAELEPGDIRFRSGAPAMPKPAVGRFLDRAS